MQTLGFGRGCVMRASPKTKPIRGKILFYHLGGGRKPFVYLLRDRDSIRNKKPHDIPVIAGAWVLCFPMGGWFAYT